MRRVSGRAHAGEPSGSSARCMGPLWTLSLLVDGPPPCEGGSRQGEPAFDSSFPAGSLSPTGMMEKVEAALIASSFDFS